MRTFEVEELTRRGLPHASENLELFFEAIESFFHRRKRDSISAMLIIKPTSTETELYSASTHGVDLGHRDCKGSRQSERGTGHERPESDRRSLSGNRSQGGPRLGGPGGTFGTSHGQKMIRAEERIKAFFLGTLRDLELVVVTSPLLWFYKDSKFHLHIMDENWL